MNAPGDLRPSSATPAIDGDGVSNQDAAPGDTGTVLADFWVMLRRLPRYLRLVAAMSRDPRVPRRAKAMLAVGGVYAVSPIDLVPGVIPVAGQLDDLYVILTALQQSLRMSPADVVDEHLARHGLMRTTIDDDLAAVRALVREGLSRGMRIGGRVARSIGRQGSTIVNNIRQQGANRRDQKPL